MKSKPMLPIAVVASVLSIFVCVPAALAGDVQYGRMAKYLPSNGEMNGWIHELWEMGAADEYGYRMPGTPSDLAAATWVRDRFERYGLEDVLLEPVPASFSFPDAWKLEVNGKEIPSHFLRYAGFTPAQGIRAPMVYVGTGSAAEFGAAGDVAGKIVLVDILAPATPITAFEPATLFRYDPDGTLPGDNAMENWPPTNLASSYALASARGAAGFVGILTFTVNDNDQFLHMYFDGSIPGLSVSPPVGASLRTLVASGPAEARLTLTGSNATGSIYNVLATLPGKDFGTDADRFIVVETHYDGWASNEASGTAVVLALAQYFTSAPRAERNYSILFVALGSHFGKKAAWNEYPSREYALVQQRKVKCAFVVEMIAKQFKIVDGRYVSTGLASPRGLMTNPMVPPSLVPIAADAIVKYDLDRTSVLLYFNGESIKWNAARIPVVGHIAENAPQFTSADTPNTVMVEDLRPTTAAFVDMIEAVETRF